MMAVPDEIAVAAPAPSMVITDGSLLTQAPAPTVFDSEDTVPLHRVAGPVMPAGIALTVTDLTWLHTPLVAYEIVTTPGLAPLTTPVLLTVPTLLLLLVHVPPDMVLLNVIDAPAHTDPAPVIEDGEVVTVMTFVV